MLELAVLSGSNGHIPVSVAEPEEVALVRGAVRAAEENVEILSRKLGEAFCSEDLEKILGCFRALILMFYPDPMEYGDEMDLLGAIVDSLNPPEYLSRVDEAVWYSDVGISRVLRAVKNGRVFVFRFLNGGPNEQLIINGRDRTLTYLASFNDSGPLKRFVKLFGGNVIEF